MGAPEKPTLLFSVGDVNGVGLETLYGALSETLDRGLYNARIVGDIGTIARHVGQIAGDRIRVEEDCLRVDNQVLTIEPVGVSAEIRPGVIAEDAGRLSAVAVMRSVDLLKDGVGHALVTLPISKEAILAAGYDYPGHTEMIAERSGSKQPLMVLFSPEIRVAMLTGHLPLREVADAITAEGIAERVRIFLESLSLDFGIDGPRLALLGLNPHAGDGGALGTEEGSLFGSGLELLGDLAARVDGPFPADAFFARETYKRYDGVIASYHDQGLIPMKMLAGDRGVNFTAGLDIIRTSPDHGTAFDIAGKGLASPASLISAIDAALDFIKARRSRGGDQLS